MAPLVVSAAPIVVVGILTSWVDERVSVVVAEVTVVVFSLVVALLTSSVVVIFAVAAPVLDDPKCVVLILSLVELSRTSLSVWRDIAFSEVAPSFEDVSVWLITVDSSVTESVKEVTSIDQSVVVAFILVLVVGVCCVVGDSLVVFVLCKMVVVVNSSVNSVVAFVLGLVVGVCCVGRVVESLVFAVRDISCPDVVIPSAHSVVFVCKRCIGNIPHAQSRGLDCTVGSVTDVVSVTVVAAFVWVSVDGPSVVPAGASVTTVYKAQTSISSTISQSPKTKRSLTEGPCPVVKGNWTGWLVV